MSSKKLITVFGATGAQGKSVVQALLSDGSFKVRAVTRDPTKPVAQKMVSQGVEVVKGDFDKEGDIKAAMQGAYGCFFVTNFIEHQQKDLEVKQSESPLVVMAQFDWVTNSRKNNGFSKLVQYILALSCRVRQLPNVAKALGIKHFIYSGLQKCEQRRLVESCKCHNFDGKGEVEEYLRKIGVPATSLRLPAYFENFLSFFKPHNVPNKNVYTVAMPMGDVPLDGMAVEDFGPVVVSVLKNPNEYIGKDITLSTDLLTIDEYCATLSECLGKNIQNAKMSVEDYEKLGFTMAKELANMFRYYMMRPKRDIPLTVKLNPKARNFKQWVTDNKDKFSDL
ncbi:LOW QUALITY PROTEIN: nmrA-like family domain-containing protein 1 [Erpetoichthys calabaricus]|uniref:LOW QUALITY PROTEIN: nmrA-like family domain-containing protein 1 n=1 Tax=Erpetoichthys calabaricus TaxID=27687 RepID=UPI0022340597|nr:LOW QUALITY PROTEIN: nmrA-like family domain-containing protein 1 [Erpetoichthys calabaricus]